MNYKTFKVSYDLSIPHIGIGVTEKFLKTLLTKAMPKEAKNIEVKEYIEV
jgi:hypothetical protein